MEGGMRCIKFLVFIFNLLFALSGLIILVTGAVIQAGYNKYMQFVPHEIFSAPIILIVVGVIIFVIAFFGCCGAMKENNCMVLTFAVLLGIIFILEISAGIAAYVMRGELETRIGNRMSETLESYKYHEDGKPSIATDSWNAIQHGLKCCGVHNFTDWRTNMDPVTGGFPTTCCEQWGGPDPNAKCDQTWEHGFYIRGCLDELSSKIKDNVSVIGGIGIGIAFVQLIGIVFACCLSKSIRRDYETV